jgi:hypothetical protein
MKERERGEEKEEGTERAEVSRRRKYAGRLLSIAQESVFSGHTGWTCSPQELADFLPGFY